MGKGQRSARRQLQERTDRAGPSSDASGAGCSGSVAGKHVDAPEAVGHGTSMAERHDGHAGTQHAAHPHPRPATGSLHAHAAAGGREHAAAGAASVQPCPAAAPVLNQQQCEALRQAILRGDDSTVIQYAATTVDLNVVYERGVTALMLAAKHRRASSVFALLLRHANVAAIDADGRTVLDYAHEGGDLCLAAVLMWLKPGWRDKDDPGLEQEEGGGGKAGAAAAAPTSDMRHDPSAKNAANWVEAAADMMQRYMPGFSPIMLAAMHGALLPLTALLQRAREEEEEEEAGGVGSQGGKPTVTSTAPRAGRRDRSVPDPSRSVPDPSRSVEGGQTSRGGARGTAHRATDQVTTHHRTALHYAACCVHHAAGAAAARLLVAAGADTEARDSSGDTALNLAVLVDSAETVGVLLAAGANPQVYDLHGCSALEVALRHGNAEVALQLLAAGADVTLPDAQGRRDLARAGEAYVMAVSGVGVSQPPAVAQLTEQLLARGVPPDVVFPRLGTTMLMAACGALRPDGTGSTRTVNTGACRALLAAGASVDATIKGGMTALHCACVCRVGQEVVGLLLEAGADAEAVVKNEMGESTPLTIALGSGCLATVELLLKSGKVNPNRAVRLNMGLVTPLMLASKFRPEAVAPLLAAGADPNLAVIWDEVTEGEAPGRRLLRACTPLEMAARGANLGAAARLLKAGADPALLPKSWEGGSMPDWPSAAEGSGASCRLASMITGPRALQALMQSVGGAQAQGSSPAGASALERRRPAHAKKGTATSQQQQQQQQQQWGEAERAKAEEMAAQLLAEEEAEKAKAAAKGSKAKGAKAAKQGKGARGAKGVPEASGPGKEDEAVQVGVEEGDREATEGASAASSAAASEAGPSSSAVAVRGMSAAEATKAVGGQPAVQAAAHTSKVRDSAASASGPEDPSSAASSSHAAPASSSLPTVPTPSSGAPPSALFQAPMPTPSSGTAPSTSSVPLLPAPFSGKASSALSMPHMPNPFSGAAPPPYAAAPLSISTATAPSPAAPPPTMHDDGLCVVCMERRRSTVLVPCSHVVMCQACCDAVREARDECPMCREPIDAVLVLL